MYFKDKSSEIFKGCGQTLGGEKKPSRLVESNLDQKKTNLPGDSAKEERKTALTEAADVETSLPGEH